MASLNFRKGAHVAMSASNKVLPIWHYRKFSDSSTRGSLVSLYVPRQLDTLHAYRDLGFCTTKSSNRNVRAAAGFSDLQQRICMRSITVDLSTVPSENAEASHLSTTSQATPHPPSDSASSHHVPPVEVPGSYNFVARSLPDSRLQVDDKGRHSGGSAGFPSSCTAFSTLQMT